MTAPRIVVSGATTAITRRTTLRKAFLGPWHELVGQCFLFGLADAQRHTDVEVHHSVRVITHHHTNVTPTRNNLPEFLRRFHRDVSCSLHHLLCELKYDAPRELFDDRQAHLMRLLDAEAQASQLVYEHLNPPAAGLVLRPEHMPGTVFDFDLWKVGYIEVERPPVYFDKSRPERLRLIVTPPPLLYQAFEGDLDRLVYHMKKLAEDGLRALRAERKGPVLGARKLERLHPWSEPRTMREPGGGRVPSFRVGARGILGREKRIEGALEVRAFRQDHRETRIARLNGDLERAYPFGTYAAAEYHGAPVEPEPPAQAIVAQPGPLLCDVQADLAAKGSRDTASTARDEARAGSFALLDRVREALRDEAAEIVEDATLDFVEPTQVQAAPEPANDNDRDTRSPAVVRHRWDRRRDETARRVITLRDRRRGRPPRRDGGGGKHGSDPPS